MKTDTFIEIGSQHEMCEDYIISGDNYIILADGCSSSKHSEMGARFLCYMAKQFMKLYGIDGSLNYVTQEYPTNLGNWVIHNAETLSRQLGLQKTCLDATLIVAYLKEDYVHIHMFGDGYVVLETALGQYEIYQIEFKAGTRSMPFYLRYLIDPEGKQQYHKQKVTKTTKISIIPNNGSFTVKDPLESAYDQIWTYHFPIQSFKSISICSDGLGTFLRPQPDEAGNKIMKVEDMVPLIFDFKSSTGVFLKREINICKRQLKNLDLKFEHFDDLSIGTFLKEESLNAKDNQTEQCN